MTPILAEVRLKGLREQLDHVRRSGSRIVLEKIHADINRAEAVLRDAEMRERRAAA